MIDKIIELSANGLSASAFAERTNGINDLVNVAFVKKFTIFIGPLGALFFRPVFA